MRLSEFILANSERILGEWEAFARGLAAAESMDIAALRDHAHQMLTVMAHDLETPQSKREEENKAKGRSDSDDTTADTPAQEHGSDRAESGFTVEEMVSEYRAMRASVIRLWSEERGELKAPDVADLVRFNEAIDQALAESTSRFMADLDHTKEMFIGILGHDLRTPLGAIVTAARFMLEAEELSPTAHELTGRIVSSGVRMDRMVADLLDFTRLRLASLPIVRVDMDLEEVLKEAVEETRGSSPDSDVQLVTSGNLRGTWDRARLSQVLSNLLSNAVHHGFTGTPILAAAYGEADSVVVSVRNQGRPIPRDQFQHIFNPLRGHANGSSNSVHLGLGLYIAERVVVGHSGTIDVESSLPNGTTFTVRLPRT
jgi:signal transduction histidine kinase